MGAGSWGVGVVAVRGNLWWERLRLFCEHSAITLTKIGNSLENLLTGWMDMCGAGGGVVLKDR